MPPLPTVSGVIEVALHWTVGEDASCQTKLHFSATGSPFTAADLATMATAVRTAVSANLASTYGSATKLTEVTCTDLGSTTGTQGVDGTAVSGASTGGLPAMAACLVNYKIARRYRGGKPRSYFPIGNASYLADPQTWSGSGLTSLQTAITGLMTAIVGHTFGAIVVTAQVSVSYYSGGSWAIVSGRPHFTPTRRATPLVDTVLSAIVAQKLGTQRRRMAR